MGLEARWKKNIVQRRGKNKEILIMRWGFYYKEPTNEAPKEAGILHEHA